MKIGIIGIGYIGKTLVRKLSAEHTVLMANSRGPDSLKELAEETGAAAVTSQEAVKGVDVVILSVPLAKVPQMKEIFAHAAPEIVVADTSNYYPGRDGSIEALDTGQVESLWVSEQVGQAVVKAWNNIFWGSLMTKGKPKGAEGRVALSVAGDDAKAKEIVMGLVEETGFDAIDLGSLEDSWRQQPGTPGYCNDLGAEELRHALANADRASAPGTRDAVMARMLEIGENITNDELLDISRLSHK